MSNETRDWVRDAKEFAPTPAEAQVAGDKNLLADLETVWHSVSDDRETNAAYTRLSAALSAPPRLDDGEAVDGCTESNCPRCQTAPHARGDMRHAGIGTRPDDGEAAAWRYRHPSIDSPSGWHRWIVSNEKPCKKYHDSEYQPLYAHPAPADVARLVDVDEAMVERALSAPYGRFAVSSFIPLKSPANIRALMRAALTAALAPFTAAQQEAQTDGR